MQLYTSLVQLKQAMNGGHLPPMTPLSPRALTFLDPAFTIGMGALDEDPEKGLRCPVRGCGVWRHLLGAHANKSHAKIGGAAGLARLLDIPTTVSLCSQSLSARRREHGRASGFGERQKHWPRPNFTPEQLKARGRARGRTMVSVAARNVRGACEAQLKHRYIDLLHKNGRQPSLPEFKAEYGASLGEHIRHLYGTWNNAVTHFGFEPMSPHCGTAGRPYTSRLTGTKLTTETLLASLGAWYDAHGELPHRRAAARRDAVPLLHAASSYLRAFKTDSWSEAMRRAASLLDIHGGRYGLPIRSQDAAAD